MIDDKGAGFLVSTLAIVLTILTTMGINFKWIHSLQAKVNKFPEKYIMKEDFNHRMDRLEDALEKGITGVHERMDGFMERRKCDRK